MLKVALFDGCGYSEFPEHIQKEIKEKDFPYRRCGSVIDILENYPIYNKELFQQKFKTLQDGDVIRYNNTFYFGTKLRPIKCSIVNVDNSKKWTISEWDGAEYIEYLELKLISKELNYWEK